MTSTHILEHLAKELSIPADRVRVTLEMLDAGLSAPFIGRFRRPETGELPEGLVRRLNHLRDELTELDRRRATILRMLENTESVSDKDRERIEKCMDRFELEDLFVPHRRPEPEVQLALDRGLGALADALTKPLPRPKKPESSQAEEPATNGEAATAVAGPAPTTAEHRAVAPEEPAAPEAEPAAQAAPAPEAEAPAPSPEVEAPAEAAPAAEASPENSAAPAEAPPDAHAESAAQAEPAAHSPAPDSPAAAAEAAPATEPGSEAAPQAKPGGAPAPAAKSKSKGGAKSEAKSEDNTFTLTPELARICAEFVSPDRGIHTEMEALIGAMRILADRLGRNAKLRGTIRRAMRKSGVLSVRPTVEESKLGRHKSLLRMKSPVRQVQGRQLLGIRQAQKERVLTTNVVLARDVAFSKVRTALGKHTHPEFEGVLKEVARQALEYRLIPTVEADVRLELKERGDDEALRFLSQHLRQILLTSAAGHRPAIGLDVNAKGDWTLARIDQDGGLRGPCILVATGDKSVEDLGKELAEHLRDDPAGGIAVGHGKGARTALPKIRKALAAGGLDIGVHIVNDGGLSSYANSELARKELPEATVPQRMAISLGRRIQDPMSEILKVDPRQLGLGSEQGLVTKAALKRMLAETIESCVAHVGCDVNRAPFAVLRHVPGVNDAAARKIIEMRVERPFNSREELRAEGLLSEAEWTSAIAFLRIHHGAARLDSTGLHPLQYDLVSRIVESTGGSVEESLGRPGITQGLRRVDFQVDEYTWRDLVREIAYPGRDPRPRIWSPELLDPATDPVTLTKDRVIEGIVSNVASFGAFLDVGLENDAMIHISEISDRYVRDARELLHVGQVVRVRILENNGQRLSVSLKKVPRREPGGGRGRARSGRGGHGAREPRTQQNPNLRAAQTRRDGLAGGREGRGGGRGRGGPGGGRGGSGGGRGGSGGGGRGGPGRGRGGRDRYRDDERVTSDELERAGAAGTAGFNPFAKFFKQGEEGGSDAKAPEPTPDESAS